jgi:endoglucanase
MKRSRFVSRLMVAGVVLALAATSVLAANVSVTATPSNRYPSANIDSDNDGQTNYIMEPNLWNVTSGSGSVTMSWTDSGGLSVDINLSNITQEDPNGWVHAYPEIWYGAKPWNTLGPVNEGCINLPQRLGSMNDIRTVVSYNVTRTDQYYNFPLETWLTRDTGRGEQAIQSDEIELMIWLDGQGLQGAGGVVGSFSSGGRSYNVYRSGAVGNGSWEYFAFVPTSPQRSGTVTVQWGPFIEAARSYSDRPSWENLYFTAVEVGTEFGAPSYLQTSLAWTLSRFDIECLSTPMLGGGTQPTPTTPPGQPTPTRTPTTQPGQPTPTRTPTSVPSGQACSPATSRSLPFSQDGSGTYCWSVNQAPSYINSWNMATLQVNGVDFTNRWASASQLPAPINGQYYIYYVGNYPWSHFEAAAGTTVPTPTSAPGATPTRTPTTPPSQPTPTRTATATPSGCLPSGARCTSNSQCCSGVCSGWWRRTCR